MLRVADHSAKSDTGLQRRANEDSYLARAPLFVVADGMGGAQAGEVASRLAVESFERGLPDGGAQPAERRLAARVEEANQAIHRLSRRDAQRAGMGTTITAAYVDADDVAIAHVGDSRAYLLRDGRLERLTDDHSLVEELLRQHKITPQEAAEHPQRSIITRALGPEPEVRVDTRTLPARDGDLVLLCSDGLTSMIGEDAIERILAAAGDDLTAAAQRLVAAANEAGGRDNITVVLFRVEEVDAPRDWDSEQPTSASPAVVLGDGGDGGGKPTGGGVATAAPPAPAAVPRARTPRAAQGAVRAPRPPARRRVPRPVAALLVAVAILVPVLTGAWFAIQSVYFVGTDQHGRVTLYRGVPYALPGLALYEPQFVSGVPALELPPARRAKILDHSLHSRDDAVDLVRQIELGRIQGAR